MNPKLPLTYNYRAPKGFSEKSPAIIMLHGYGSNENDLFSFAEELPEHFAIFSLKAPLKLQPYGNAWYSIYFDQNTGKFSNDEEAIESRDIVVSCIDEIIEKFPIDANNITFLGFSQGTILSFSIALSYPEKIKNIIGLSGYINEAILKEGYVKNDFNNLNIYTSHGTVDQVIPVDWARKTKPFLEHLSISVTYEEFPVGHGVAPQNFYSFKKWLEAR